jgi:hypothetical protein
VGSAAAEKVMWMWISKKAYHACVHASVFPLWTNALLPRQLHTHTPDLIKTKSSFLSFVSFSTFPQQITNDG